MVHKLLLLHITNIYCKPGTVNRFVFLFGVFHFDSRGEVVFFLKIKSADIEWINKALSIDWK